MALYLVEGTLKTAVNSKDEFEQKVDHLQSQLSENNASLIEVQVAKDFKRLFFIVESDNEQVATSTLEKEDINAELVKEVRLVGQDLEEVKQQKDVVNYLVEWNLPENLTMDQYLSRKRANSVHYEEVPEVTFSRTYVCEDMTKCLCFYDAPNEEAVKRAREAVKAPIDAITELSK